MQNLWRNTVSTVGSETDQYNDKESVINQDRLCMKIRFLTAKTTAHCVRQLS